MRRAVAVSLFLMVVPLAAQYSPLPQLGKRSPSSQRRQSSKEPDARIVRGEGVVSRIDEKSIEVSAEDSETLTCALSAQTRFSGPLGDIKPAEIHTGSHVQIEATSDADGNLTAKLVTLEAPEAESKEPAREEPKETAHDEPVEKTATIKAPASDDEDAPPVLRHGIPPKRPKSKEQVEDEAAAADAQRNPVPIAAKPPESPPEAKPHFDTEESPLITKARQVNTEFGEKLPNFVCQQFTTRYQMESKASGWSPVDVVSADVVYVDGTEDYQNIRVGNRKISGKMMDLKGQRSTGEYGSILASLMSQAARATFTPLRDTEISHVQTKIFSFKVLREYSDWRVIVGGQSIRPGYSGRIWIDKDSGRLLRLERQADSIPEEFPTDHIEQSVDYAFIMLGERKVLLPSDSENLSCERGSPSCSRNVIEFRNYKEFRGKATIDFSTDQK